MKKLLLVSAVLALSVPVAQAAPKLYGKAFLTADYVSAKADNINSNYNSKEPNRNLLEVNSHLSQLGFRGSETITANTDVIYQLESGIEIDGDDEEITFSSRDTYLGLKNKSYGEFRFGRNTSVLDYVNNVDVSNGYWDNLGVSRLEQEDELKGLNMLDYSRQNNSVVWIAPTYNDLELALQYAADESTIDAKNGYGASLMFDKGTGFTAGIAYSKDMDVDDSITVVDFDGADAVEQTLTYGGDVIRGTATIDLSQFIDYPLTLGAMYQQTDYDFTGSDKEKGLMVSGEMDLANFDKPTAVYMQYSQTSNLNGLDDNDSDQIILGGKYNFKENIIAHAYIGQNKADYTNPMDPTNTVEDIQVFAVGGGLEYLF